MKLIPLLLLFPVAMFAAPLPPNEASVYLAQLAASRPKESATTVQFHETRKSRLLAKPVISNGELTFQPPMRFRREIFGANGSLIVSNGEMLWIYYPAFKEVERYSLKSGKADAFRGLMAAFNLQDVERWFRFTVERDGEIHRITLVPKRRAERRLFDELRLEVGGDQKLRRAAWTSPDGEKTEMTFSGERRTSGARFDFQPPAGVKVSVPLGR